jgi:hypothetical protein
MKDSYAKGKNESDAFYGRGRFLGDSFSIKILTPTQSEKYHHYIRGTHGHDFAVCYANSVREKHDAGGD